MATEIIANNPTAPGTLSSGINSSVTSLSISSATGYPTSGNFRILIDSEVMGVAAVSGTTFTVSRGIEGTTAASHSSGVNINIIVTAQTFAQMRGDMNQYGSRASLPATTGQQTGNVYRCSDSPYEYYFDGTVWQARLDGTTVSEPNASTIGFSWANQGSTVEDATHGGLQLQLPTSSGDNLRVRYITQPSTPYSIQIGYKISGINANFYNSGLCLYNTSNGKLATFGVSYAIAIQENTWNSVTSISSTTINTSWTPGTSGIIWLKIVDDGTNRKFFTNCDLNTPWTLLGSEANTTFLTPNAVGYYMDVNNSSLNQTMWLLHWKQGTS